MKTQENVFTYFAGNPENTHPLQCRPIENEASDEIFFMRSFVSKKERTSTYDSVLYINLHLIICARATPRSCLFLLLVPFRNFDLLQHLTMVLFKWMAVLVLLVSLPSASLAFGWNYNPFNATAVCDGVQCGKGKCVSNSSAPFAFVCECDSGWKRTRLDNEDDLKFLPCVIPSCSVQYSCMPAPPPLPPVPHNVSFFDPCYWSYCGGGTCNKSSTSPHDRICQCNPGYTNLMNISVFPCFNNCAIGSDCSKLGIKVADSTSTPGSGDSYAHASLPGRLLWAIILATSMALALWK